MSDGTFRELRTKVFRLHEEGRYREALELVGQEAANHPDQYGDVMFWRGCLAALVGDADGAIEFLQEAVDQGYW